MKLNSLQLKKAMSAALFVLLLSVVGMKNALAQTQVATLQHGDSISGVYYGQNAFVSAHSAAVDGDIITLSSGTFNKCDINKSITIRGAGCVYDTLTQVSPTIIPGDFSLRRSNISFEGVQLTGFVSCWSDGGNNISNNISFVKCHINKAGYNNTNVNFQNWQFVNCIIKELVSARVGNIIYSFQNLSLVNCVVRITVYRHGSIYNPNTINNSIVLFDNGQPVNNIVASNSIIATVSEHTVSNCTFFNCIGIETGETSLFEGQTASNCMEVNNYDDVFETFTGEVIYDNIYQLKEEVVNSFLGNDGSEVGIYGGMMPYNPRPTYMVMKRCNVASRSTVDGKLSVDIEVLTEGE